MLCLGIETSCDETALALVRDKRLVGQKLASQERMHALFGGVVPELASREHLRVIGPLFDALLAETTTRAEEIEGIAVARGPGLLGSLLVGLGLAKGLAISLDRPLVGINHLVAHLLAPGLEQELDFPALGLVASGGHTQIGLLTSPFAVSWLGRTLDDAVGEAYDKTARMLNLPYPGGKTIDALAQFADPDTGLLPRPYVDNQNLDFSFSGLKTAVARIVADNPRLVAPVMEAEPDIPELAASRPGLAELCASLNWSIASTIRLKLRRAMARHPEVKALIAAGGVVANSCLRRELAATAEECGVRAVLPRMELCTDNAAMIAYAGSVYLEAGYAHGMDLDAVPRGKPLPDDFIRVS
ncbi:tRNA (adenosine(37)-N6)-threonylcarbamoyltransferase complex transferase subunit TsaD [Desulfovermiculus halophilus]|jgi:N6-L-threonylcarbamoyladenine synthase|uniref:tRNA (adenosine(37)-N6)-threonylcarbamoyltransferase complex transferase subunit TsaD n=1 Tax=Desulfovermiculus halophilus TaxID=339722 RepID=UPI000486AE02|nr:tRNA (adenosine(37)-N6)-threonylcarbamoyltransferase complex transferase subunit TsaD [Desulfovermiculus halophilus]